METTLLNVIRGYLPLLVGIAVAVVNLHATHTAQANDESRLAPAPKVVKMETIVVTAQRERPMTVSYAANAR